MENLLIMLSVTMSTEQILDRIQQSLNEYLANPSEEAKDHIALICGIYLAHMKTNGTMEGAMEMLKDFKKFENREKLFNPDKN